MTKYRKKPVVIDAVQFTDDTETIVRVVEWVEDLDMSTSMIGRSATVVNIREHGYFINTLEGKMKVNFGDYVIKGVAGEFYPCRADIFEATYDNAYPKVNSSNIGRIVIPTRYIRDHTYAVMDLLRDVLIVEATTHFEGRTEYIGLSHKFKEVHPSCEAPIYGFDITTYNNGTVEMKLREGE